MKPVLAALIVFSSLIAAAQSYPPYPGGSYPPPPPGGSYPPSYPPNYPPSYPPPSNSVCKLEYSGSYYYVSKDGQRFTELTQSPQQAISQKQQLENQGMCRTYGVDPGSCQLEFSGSYYYVSRAGTRFSSLVSNYADALRTRDMLYQSRNCNESTYRPNASCKIEYSGSYYYVSRNGTRFTGLTSNLNDVTRMRDDLTRNYVCVAQYQSAPCRLEFSGSYYYLSINSARSSELTSSLMTILNQQRDFASRGLCSQPSYGERCTIEYSGSYYYVARNGSRISELTSSLPQVDNTLRQLQYSRNCL
jgi:hypothetical protein